MTKSTPAPAEPFAVRYDVDDLAARAEEFANRPASEGAQVMIRRLVYALRMEHAERDALAAALAEVRAIEPTWPRGMYGAPQDMIGRTALDRVLSKLPADALAARDARVLDRIINHLRSTVRLGLGLTPAQKQDRRNIIEWLEADCIEREAQR